MKSRFIAAAVAAFILVTSACVPKPIGPSHNLVVSHRTLGYSPWVSGPFTIIQGTVTNTGVTPADYTVEVVASSGETQPSSVLDVLVGETGIWSTTLDGDVEVSQVRVSASTKIVGPVPAVAVITSQQVGAYADAPARLYDIRGTVTNTGTTAGRFSIELQSNTGAVGATSAIEVPAGQTVPWNTVVLATGTYRILRITTYHPHPTPPPPPP
jgi:hypothetical protein